MRDLYEVMGLAKTATDEEIRKAYRQLAIKYHPDKNPGDQECVEKFKEISNAFEVLGDPNSRKEYDTFGTVPNRGRNPFGQGKPFTSAFDDMFAQFFTERRRTVHKGDNVVVEVPVTLYQVLNGPEIEIPFTRHSVCQHCKGSGGSQKQCPECQGSGAKVIHGKAMTVRAMCHACSGSGKVIGDPCGQCQNGFGETYTDVIRMKLPTGVETGMRFGQAGLGEPSTHPEGVPGDLFLNIKVQTHPLFERRENGIISIEWPFSYSELVFGCEAEVPTLEGKVKVKIPPGTSPGTKFRLKNMGLPLFAPDGSIYPRGDQHVCVKLQMPKDLDGLQKETIEGLAKIEQPIAMAARTELIEKLGEDDGRPQEK